MPRKSPLCRRCNLPKPRTEYPSVGRGRCWTCYSCLGFTDPLTRPAVLSPVYFAQRNRKPKRRRQPVPDLLPMYPDPTPEEIDELDDGIAYISTPPENNQHFTVDSPALLCVLPDEAFQSITITFPLTAELRLEARRVIRPGGTVTVSTPAPPAPHRQIRRKCGGRKRTPRAQRRSSSDYLSL